MRDQYEELCEEIQSGIAEVTEKAAFIRAEHIEMMAAAYIKKTCIDPRDVVLIEEHKGNLITWYFAKQEDVESLPLNDDIPYNWMECG